MSLSKMTPIEYFDPQEADQAPVYFIVRAKRVAGFEWQRHEMYLATWDPVSGFMCNYWSTIQDAVLHDVTHFHITDIPVQ